MGAKYDTLATKPSANTTSLVSSSDEKTAGDTSRTTGVGAYWYTAVDCTMAAETRDREYSFNDTATKPAGCAGATHSVVELESQVAGTDTSPKMQSIRLAGGSGDTSSRSVVPPAVEPTEGDKPEKWGCSSTRRPKVDRSWTPWMRTATSQHASCSFSV
eukprot:scaffold1484_cov241-Pinguiococcus_pyrenoidosus.AAC.3